ncbi:bifunctional adenosylcobinamide kinase/adenosylcobinamide-phosphate guanylyltransferase [Lentisphaerota bacterium WC36G]|nr:bifunctional adenosylcobinamide kinase/adenosylcobinamide-phosphate guanylyltransferase [Lentisphaerae bacterium WC36]
MAEIFLITGGARSGKSCFAEGLADKLFCDFEKNHDSISRKAYIATAVVFDDEMRERVRKHQEQRATHNWVTFEEQLNLAKKLEECQKNNFKVILVDCLTLWINNLLFDAEQKNQVFTEEMMVENVQNIIKVCEKAPKDFKIIFVINEVGLGIVPENKLARIFRDLSGRCSQTLAKYADNVYFVSCGIPLQLKGSYNAAFRVDN